VNGRRQANLQHNPGSAGAGLLVLPRSGCGLGFSGNGFELKRRCRCVVSSGDRTLRPLVDVQLENVGTGIVAHNIEVVLTVDDLSEIDFRDENGFALRVWSGKEIPEGIHDATSAAANYRLWIGSEE
jgi:hypothetical protein